MSAEGESNSGEIISAEERAQLKRKWAAGHLRHPHEKILEFAREQRGVILQLAGGVRDARALADATCRLIATLRTVHHASEMHDQMREIHNQIWYCGERGDHDINRIKLDWVADNGLNWRRWRIKEYLFLAESCADEIAERINAP